MPYLKDANNHDFGHIINKFRFITDNPRVVENILAPREAAFRRKLGLKDPLENTAAHTEECPFPDLNASESKADDIWISQLHVPVYVTSALAVRRRCLTPAMQIS